jgi:hypothetical protein
MNMAWTKEWMDSDKVVAGERGTTCVTAFLRSVCHCHFSPLFAGRGGDLFLSDQTVLKAEDKISRVLGGMSCNRHVLAPSILSSLSLPPSLSLSLLRKDSPGFQPYPSQARSHAHENMRHGSCSSPTS